MKRPTVEEILDSTSKSVHDYDSVYARIPRDGIRSVLEVGCTENSLRAYGEIFPRAGVIWGVDLEPRVHEEFLREHSRIQFQQVDVYTDGLHLPAFDLIVDDANHYWEKQVALYQRLQDYWNPGGFYVIEDVFTPSEIQKAIPTAYIVRTGQNQDSVIALIQKGW